MITINLTQGQVATVDDRHYDWVSKHRWFTQKSKSGKFYATRYSFVNGKQENLYLHREVMGVLLGRELSHEEEVDHVDLNPLNNVEDNLRLASRGQNARNTSKHKDNTSGYKGVNWNTRVEKWLSRICVDLKRVHLGYFSNPEDAARAYDRAAIELHGEFAKTNFPVEDYTNE